jgi:hypothetical protein
MTLHRQFNRFVLASGIALSLVVGPSAASAADDAAPLASAAACDMPLQSLVNAAPAGGTLVVPPCIYRETVTIAEPLTVIGQVGAEIRGSDVWSDWSQVDDLWVSRRSVPALPTVTADPHACDAGGDACLWPEQVFVDGQALSPVRFESRPGAGQFGLDGRRRVVIAKTRRGT